MTRDKAIAKLVRIWHSPHLDLSLKAELAEAIETLKENNQSDSLVTDSSDDCKEIESKLDLISRQDAIEAVVCHIWHMPNEAYRQFNCENIVREVVEDAIKRLPSAEAVTHGRLIDADALSEKLCKTTIFVKDGSEFQRMIHDAPTVSAEPKTGEWIDYIGEDLGIEGQWLRDDGKTIFVLCDQCDSMFVRNLMTHMNFCPNCGARMFREDDEG